MARARRRREHRQASRGRSRWIFPLIVVSFTFVTFWPALSNDFVNWDDAGNLTENPLYRGMGWSQLRWMWTTTLMGLYIPLTWMTFGLDYLVWGMNPVGYHLTRLLLHTANAGLFYLIAQHDQVREDRARLATSRMLALHVHGVFLDANRVGRHVAGHGPAQELAGAHVEAGVVQRALDHVAHELAGRERRARVAADVAERVVGAGDVRDQHALAIDHDPLHRARRQLGGSRHGHEAFEHAAIALGPAA